MPEPQKYITLRVDYATIMKYLGYPYKIILRGTRAEFVFDVTPVMTCAGPTPAFDEQMFRDYCAGKMVCSDAYALLMAHSALIGEISKLKREQGILPRSVRRPA